MQIKKITIFSAALWLITFCVLVAGCSGKVAENTTIATLTQTPTAIQSTPTIKAPTHTPTASPAPTAGMTVDESTTLNSLQMVDKYPFYTMAYSGGYDDLFISPSPTEVNSFGCSLFAAFGPTGDKLYGRNFDWDYSPALLLFTDPPDGYASASMVDLTFLGISPDEAVKLADMPIAERTDLLVAPMIPFDGMNEYGLTVGMAAIPDEFADDASYDPSRPSIHSTGIIRVVLDHARNVDEAVELFGKYNISFAGGPPIHYLLADRSGKSVLIEFYKGEMMVLPNENPWHLATNHLRCIAQGDGGCWRYHILSMDLSSAEGNLDEEAAMRFLAEVRQPSTQWSTVYNMDTGKIQVAIHQSYQESYSFQLGLITQ